MRTSSTLTAITAAGITAAALFTPAATAAATDQAASPARACTTWQALSGPTAPSPNAGQIDSVAVDAVSPNDVWFPGMVTGFGNSWNLRWNGHTVQAAPALPPPPQGTSLFGWSGASFDSAADGWAMYSYVNLPAPADDPAFSTSPTIAARWHGGRWTVTPMAVSPDPQTSPANAAAVASLSPGSAWAVGGFGSSNGGSTGALTEHWDGTQWSLVPNPASAQPGAFLDALTVVSPTEIWAVGEQFSSNGDGSTPLAEHWDGSTWSTVAIPAGTGPYSSLDSVSADSAGDIWAAGLQGTLNGDGAPLLEHWDGSGWSTQQIPDVDSSTEPPHVYAAAADDVWLTVQDYSGAPGSFLHWDGATWTTEPVPGPHEYGAVDVLGDISGTGPGDIWATAIFVESADNSYLEQIYHLSCGQEGT